MRLDATSLTSRYRAQVGFVSTPKYFDDVVQEFLRALAAFELSPAGADPPPERRADAGLDA